MNYRARGIPAVLSRAIPGNALRAFPASFRDSSGISSGKSQPYCGYGPFVRVLFIGFSSWYNMKGRIGDFEFRKRGILEKGSFQKSPFSRDSREFRDSRDFREHPDCGKLEILEIPPVKRPFRNDPLFRPRGLHNGSEWRKFCSVPRSRTPCTPCMASEVIEEPLPLWQKIRPPHDQAFLQSHSTG